MQSLRTLLLPIGLVATMLQAQMAINPQLGVSFQNLTDAPDGVEFKAAVGAMVGLDMRIGGRFYFQPGAFYEQNATTVSVGDSAVIEDNLIRSSLKLKALAGYNLIDGDAFRLRVNTGPTYDLLLGVKDKDSDDPIEFEKEDFNNGSFNWNAGVGADISIITLETGVCYGLSNVFNDDEVNFTTDPKNFTFYFTAGLVFGGANN